MGTLFQFGDMRHFGGAQGMQPDIRELRFDLPERVDIILQPQFGMVSSLEQQLITPVLDRFPDLLPIGVHVGDVRFRMAGDAVEIAKFTIGDADVGGVDVAIDLPGHFAMRDLFFAQLIRDMDQVGQRGVMIEMQPFFGGKKFEAGGFGVYVLEIHAAKLVEEVEMVDFD